jgi:hypothetical protein
MRAWEERNWVWLKWRLIVLRLIIGWMRIQTWVYREKHVGKESCLSFLLIWEEHQGDWFRSLIADGCGSFAARDDLRMLGSREVPETLVREVVWVLSIVRYSLVPLSYYCYPMK